MSTPPTLLYGIWHPNFVFTLVHHHNHFTAFFWDHLGKTVPEENFWTLWCKGRLTEADTLAIWLGATPSGPTSAHLHHPPIHFYIGHKMEFYGHVLVLDIDLNALVNIIVTRIQLN